MQAYDTNIKFNDGDEGNKFVISISPIKFNFCIYIILLLYVVYCFALQIILWLILI